VVGDGWGVQIVDENGTEPDVWAVLRFEEHQTTEQMSQLILTALG
jgi:hypothetical protein